MSKYKTVMQKNRRAAYVLGMTVAEYVTTVVWPKVRAKQALHDRAEASDSSL
jgi:ABC-type phosphate transport system permease subunit